MPDELTVFLAPLQSLLDWFRKNRDLKDEQTTIALNAMNKSLVSTRKYIEECREKGAIDRAREFELSELWADAATKARHASEDVAARLCDKSLYWSQPLKWSREEVLLKKIDLEAVHNAVKELLTSA